LSKKAGIESAIERCVRLLEPDYFEDRHLPPLFTKARSAEQQKLDERKFQAFRYCKRDVIFAVTDVELRRQLISLERKFHDLRVRSFQNDLAEARRRLNQARMPDRYTSLFAAIGGAVVVVLGWQFGGVMGGTAAAVFALILAMYALPELERSRALSVQQATEEVADLEATINNIVEEEIFTQLEEDTGETCGLDLKHETQDKV
jgi:ABC-type transport system involved in cytochrome bd biosynthesis fused ATPase/permease subunit